MYPAGGEISQRDLIARAFAGDNVAAEFEAEKQAEAERELPTIDTPTILPGWGSWASAQKEPKWLAAAKLKAERQDPPLVSMYAALHSPLPKISARSNTTCPCCDFNHI